MCFWRTGHISLSLRCNRSRRVVVWGERDFVDNLKCIVVVAEDSAIEEGQPPKVPPSQLLTATVSVDDGVKVSLKGTDIANFKRKRTWANLESVWKLNWFRKVPIDVGEGGWPSWCLQNNWSELAPLLRFSTNKSTYQPVTIGRKIVACLSTLEWFSIFVSDRAELLDICPRIVTLWLANVSLRKASTIISWSWHHSLHWLHAAGFLSTGL